MNAAYALILVIIFIPLALYVYAALRGAPFFPSFPRAISAMKILAEIKPEHMVADLGSGDGRILLAIKDSGAELHGFEINPLVYWFSKYRLSRAGIDSANKKIQVFRKDFWPLDFSGYDVVIVFGINSIMPKLERKLKKELKPGARVLSNSFQFPNWQHQKKLDTVYLYIQE